MQVIGSLLMHIQLLEQSEVWQSYFKNKTVQFFCLTLWYWLLLNTAWMCIVFWCWMW